MKKKRITGRLEKEVKRSKEGEGEENGEKWGKCVELLPLWGGGKGPTKGR